jgi:hypothetical protein
VIIQKKKGEEEVYCNKEKRIVFLKKKKRNLNKQAHKRVREKERERIYCIWIVVSVEEASCSMIDARSDVLRPTAALNNATYINTLNLSNSNH